MPKVSVILPTYNCAEYLCDAVSSVLSQTFKDLELIIVDDGSTDSTDGLIARRFSDARIIYVKQKHSGLAEARNNGINIARGEYIAFIDADDIFLQQKLERQLLLFDKYRNINVVYSSEKYFYNGDKDTLFESPHEKLSGDILFFLKRSNFIHISTVMLKRSVLGDIRFDPELKSHEDWDFFLKLSKECRSFFYLPENLVLVRVRRDSMTARNAVMDASRAIVGKRAKYIWGEIKKEMGIKSKYRIRLLYRYAYSKVRAEILGFPHSARFNRPSVFKDIASRSEKIERSA